MRTVRGACLLLVLAYSGCGGSDGSDSPTDPEPVEPGTPVSLAAHGGDGQSGTVGQELDDALVVRLTDAQGIGVPGRSVTFAVTSGGGSLFVESATTDSNGAAATRWTLGTSTAEAQAVEGRIVVPETGDGLVAVFSAQALAGPPVRSTEGLGSGQSGDPATPLADSLAVQVFDAYENPVLGTTVDWFVTAGGGAVSPTTSLTEGDGTAATQWTLGPDHAEDQRAEARIADLPAIVFEADAALSGSPVDLRIVSGNGQAGVVDRELSDPLVVELVDSAGRPAPEYTVLFSVTSGGGSLQATETTTGLDGRATTRWTLGRSSRTAHRVLARFVDAETGTELSGSFSATPRPDAPARLVAYRGSGQSGEPSRPLVDPLQAQVSDRFGNPVPGAAVRWAVTSGGGSVSPSATTTAGNGTASTRWTLGPDHAQDQRAEARVSGLSSVPFHADAIATGLPFTEDFESGLDQWTGRPSGHHAQIAVDPLRSGNRVVRFTRPVAAGDLFSRELVVDPNARYTLTFEYLGLPRAGSTPNDHGGFIGISDAIPGDHAWLGGTDPAQAVVHLIDDGSWHSYSVTFVPSHHIGVSGNRIRVMVEDGEVVPGVPLDALFDNIRLQRTP